jgi:hypothetical protein
MITQDDLLMIEEAKAKGCHIPALSRFPVEYWALVAREYLREYLAGSDPDAALRWAGAGAEAGLQPCGHPLSAIRSSDEGTHYCAECEREAR